MKKGLFLFLFVFACSVFAVEGKRRICLNMIVKDEKEVIDRCLKSVKPLIDYWVIVDTGSTDGTQEIIRKFMKDVPGELHERKWVNFSHNRNEALDLARGKGDYIFFIDADEELLIDKGADQLIFDRDYYYFRTLYGGTSYLRLQMVKSDERWKWAGSVHEVLVPVPGMIPGTLGGYNIVTNSSGRNARDPKAFLKDAEKFQAALAKNPKDTRAAFYLAQSFRDGGEKEMALQIYQLREKMGGWDEEVFYSKYQVGLLQEALGHSSEVFLNSYYDAYAYRPTRIEPLYYVVRHCRQNKRYLEGYALAKLALEQVERQGIPNEMLFVDRWIYDYGMQLELSICAYWIGKYEEANGISHKLLEIDHLPENFRACINNNLVCIKEKLAAPLKSL